MTVNASRGTMRATTLQQGAGDRDKESAVWQPILRQSLVVIATIATIIVNTLANALPINGLDTGEISDRFDIFFVPAGYVFSIWGLIYLGLVGYTVYQALPSQRTNPLVAKIGYLYILSALANIGWIFLWHYEQFILTVPVMLLLLGTLIAIYVRINSTSSGMPRYHGADRWLVQAPFSIYLGWISVATVANVTSTLDYVNWNGWGIGEDVWFLIMLAVATLLGLIFATLRRDVAYVAVLIWAFAGIAVKHQAVPLVAGASIGAALLLGVVVIFARLRSNR
jgi:translocator protein